MYKLDLEKAEERNQIANIQWIIEKAKEFQRNIYFCFTDYAKAFDYVDHNKLENSQRDGNTRSLYLPAERLVFRSRSKLEPDMELQTGSKLGKEYVFASMHEFEQTLGDSE